MAKCFRKVWPIAAMSIICILRQLNLNTGADGLRKISWYCTKILESKRISLQQVYLPQILLLDQVSQLLADLFRSNVPAKKKKYTWVYLRCQEKQFVCVCKYLVMEILAGPQTFLDIIYVWPEPLDSLLQMTLGQKAFLPQYVMPTSEMCDEVISWGFLFLFSPFKGNAWYFLRT